MRLAGLEREGNLLFEAIGNVVEQQPVVHARAGEIAARLGDQMLQLLGQQAVQLYAHAGKIAHQNRQLLLAGQCQQRALAHDAELRRERADLEHVLARFAQLITAGRLQTLGDAHQQVAPALGLWQLEAGDRARVLFSGNAIGRQLARALADRLVQCFEIGLGPIQTINLGAFRVLALGGQLPDLQHARDFALVHRHGGADVEHVTGLAVVAVDDDGAHVVDRQAVEAGNAHVAHIVGRSGRSAALGAHALGDLQRDDAGFLGNRQGLGLDGGRELPFVVAHAVCELGAVVLVQKAGLAGFVVAQRDALFKLDRIHGLGELDGEQRAAHIGLRRVLVELRALDREGKGGRAEVEFLAGVQHHVRREGVLGQLDGVGLTDGPVVLGNEAQGLGVVPAPFAGQGGLEAHAHGVHLGAQIQGRGVRREDHAHRLGAGAVFNAGARRRGDGGGDLGGLDLFRGQPVPPFQYGGAGEPARHQDRQQHHQPHQALLQPAQTARQSAQRPTQPAGWLPGTHQCAQQCAQGAPEQSQELHQHFAGSGQFLIGIPQHERSPGALLAVHRVLSHEVKPR